VLTPAQESASAAAEFEANVPVADPAAPPGARYFQRSNPERLPNFTPKHDVDLSAETTGQWGSEGKPETSAGFRRTLTTAIIVLLVGAICVAVYFFKNSFSRQDTPSAQTEENPVASVKDAKDVLLAFFAAATPAEMAKYVRHPEITQPRMEAWYRDPARIRARASYNADSFTDEWQEVDNYRDSGVNFIATTLKSTDGNPTQAFLEVPTDNSSLKLDWEHFSGWSETRWEDFLRTTSERSTEFRVTVTPYNYYNYAYGDQIRYLSFKVADPENSAHCYAYCEARTKLGNMLLDAVREGRQAGRIDHASGEGIAQVIIRLRFMPEGKPHNQAVIDELVWNDWLKPRE
jgi:hypothetical protein